MSQQQSVEIKARISANRAAGYTYRLQWAPGIEPAESDFQDVNVQTRTTPDSTAHSATIDLQTPSAPRSTPAPEAARPSTRPRPRKPPGDKDPNEPAFTVRVRRDGHRRQPRRGPQGAVRLPRHDAAPGLREGPRLGRRGLAAPVRPERRQQARDDPADSSGELHVFNDDGTPLAELQQRSAGAHPPLPERPPRRLPRTARSTRRARCCARPRSATSTATWSPRSSTPRVSTSTPGTRTARPCPASPCGSTRRSRGPQDRTRRTTSSAASRPRRRSSDLNGDGKLDIVVPALDEHLYVVGRQRQPAARVPEAAQGRRPDHARRRGDQHAPRSATSPATAGPRSRPRPPSSTTTRPPRRRRPEGGVRRLRQLPHERARERARRQRPRVRGRPQRERPAGLADQAERDRARRAAVRRSRASTTSWPTSTATGSSR